MDNIINRLIEFLFSKGIAVGVIVVAAFLLNTIIKVFIRKFLIKRSKDKGNPQLATIFKLLSSVIKYTIIAVALIAILNVFGLGITTNSIVALIGAGGVALAFGFQDMLKDVINGFSIILEEQFNIGDFVVIGDIAGQVTNITLRSVYIKSLNNQISIIHNRNIEQVTNQSKQPPNVMVEFYISDGEKIQEALSCLRQMCKDYKPSHAVNSPSVSGVSGLTPFGAKVLIECHAAVGHRFDVEYDLNLQIIMLLNEKKISYTVGMEQLKGMVNP